MKSKKNPSRDEQKIATRGKLLKTARRVFTRRGYAETSIADLCRAAGVTHGALYHHFPGKLHIFTAVLNELVEEVADRVRAADAAADGWERVSAVCAAYLDACMERPVQVILMRDGPYVLAAESAGQGTAINEGLIIGLLEEWTAAGLIRPLPVPGAARVLGGAFAEAGAVLMRAKDTRATRAELDQVFALLLEGFRAS